MRYPASASLFLVFLAISAFAQAETRRQDRKPAQASVPRTPAGNRDRSVREGIDLLTAAEAEAGAFDSRMRSWVLWQIGLAYQSTDKAKALERFQTALITAHAAAQDSSAEKPKKNDLLPRISGRASLPPGLLLERDIARSIVLLEPKRADQVAQQIDPAIRGAVLGLVLRCQEKEKQFNDALETLKRITVQDEMPYEDAIPLMDTFKPEQAGELTELFFTALVSYRDHAPHVQMNDAFAPLLVRFWKRLPKEAVGQAIDEILKQAADTHQEGSYAAVSEKGTSVMPSLYGYRLLQIMPMLREFDPSAARQYEEKYPDLASSVENRGSAGTLGSSEADPPAANGFRYHPSGDSLSIMSSMSEQTTAQKAAAKADGGHLGEAMSDAANIVDLNLRAQVYEYIARVASKTHDSAARSAVKSMLEVAEKLEPREAFRYYGAGAEIDMEMGDADDAKQSVEAGLKVAGKLYERDSNDDDPNTALKAFWPSTNAYCTMLRQAAQISQAWAISLLPSIKDPEIKVAAKTALAGAWLKAPIGPSTIMTTNKSSNFIVLGSRE
jgi:hypothetical protein